MNPCCTAHAHPRDHRPAPAWKQALCDALQKRGRTWGRRPPAEATDHPGWHDGRKRAIGWSWSGLTIRVMPCDPSDDYERALVGRNWVLRETQHRRRRP